MTTQPTHIDYDPAIPQPKCCHCGALIRWETDDDFAYQYPDGTFACDNCAAGAKDE